MKRYCRACGSDQGLGDELANHETLALMMLGNGSAVALRERLGFSRATMARLAEVNKVSLARWELSQAKPSNTLAAKLGKAYAGLITMEEYLCQFHV